MTAGVLAIFVGLMAEQWAVDSQIEVLQRTELAGCPVTLGSVGRKPGVVCRAGLGQRRARAPTLRYTRGDVLTSWRDPPGPEVRKREDLRREMTVVDAGGYAVA